MATFLFGAFGAMVALKVGGSAHPRISNFSISFQWPYPYVKWQTWPDTTVLVVGACPRRLGRPRVDVGLGAGGMLRALRHSAPSDLPPYTAVKEYGKAGPLCAIAGIGRAL